jgi:membrane-associated PAP2 superfamily phosphatase
MRALVVYVALTALTLIVFGLRPELDLTVAHLFFDGGGFIGESALSRFGRSFFNVTPFVVMAAYTLLWLGKRSHRWRGWAPSSRAMVFIIATMIVGPGVVVNLGFKDHWHRPRPIQTQEFNGKDTFRPWYDDGGACKKNCSFVSGEASAAFWLVAPAMVVPPPARAAAIVAAFAFGVGASLLRMAFGGHYLSDVILGGLVTLIIIEIVRMLLWPRGKDPAGAEPDRSEPDGRRSAIAPVPGPAPADRRSL